MPRIRTLLKNWKLASIAVFSMAIALAVGIVGISVSNLILLRPPAAADPGRLLTIYHNSPQGVAELVSYPAYKYYRDQTHVFEDITAYPTSISKNWLSDRGEALVEVVSDNYFSVMGMRPVLGRLFSPGDDDKRLPEAVLTYSCWQKWGSDPNIIGKTLGVDQGVTVVGVAPKEFTGVIFGLRADFVVLVGGHSRPEDLAKRDARNFTLIGRLKPSMSRKQANTEMQALAQQLGTAFPRTDKGYVPVLTRALVVPPDAIKDAELISAVLLTLVLLVVLVACANVASLLLALAVRRRQETLIKTAVGASRMMLIHEFSLESLTLCILGGLGGFVLADTALRKLSAFSTTLPLLGSISITANVKPDITVAILTVALVVVASLATGLPGALYASSPNLAGALSGEIAIGGTRKGRIRSAFVIVQVMVCTLVLVGLGLCLRSAGNLRHVDPGFSARNVVGALVVDLQAANNNESQEQQRYAALAHAVSQVYGVESVSLANGLPFVGGFSQVDVDVELPGQTKPVQTASAVVDDHYFNTLGVPVFSGRVFNSSDRKDGPEVVIVNRKLAEMLWPNQDAIGKTIRIGKPARQAMVVGVVANGKYNDLDEAYKPFFYSALSQRYQPFVQIVVRTNGDPRLWAEPVTRAMQSAGFMTPLPPFTMDGLLYLETLVPMLTLYVVGGWGLLGVLLAVVGLFGAVSYSVSERKRELGIRSALGAVPSDLFRMVLREITATVGSGIVAGVLIGATATVLLRSKLFGIQSVEWVVLLPVTLSMVALAALVACLAARSWVYGDPLEAVRHA